MVGQKPSRSVTPQTFCVPAIRSRKPSRAHHKSFSLVSVASPHLWCFILMYDQASPEYLIDISHPSAASSQASTCSVEPGSAEDVSKIVSHLYQTHKLLPTSISQLCILGSTRTPFGVKSGGHSMNPGFSSTNGVQIVMTRFNETKVNSTSGTVEIGPGLTWDQVYDALEPTGVNVVGGRVPGVGVAGLALGGGEYFWSSEIWSSGVLRLRIYDKPIWTYRRPRGRI